MFKTNSGVAPEHDRAQTSAPPTRFKPPLPLRPSPRPWRGLRRAHKELKINPNATD